MTGPTDAADAAEQVRCAESLITLADHILDPAGLLVEAAEAALAAGGTVMLGPERARLASATTLLRLALNLGARGAAAVDADAAEVPEAIAQLMIGIRRRYQAVTYDARDPNRHVIETAARRQGLVLCPSTTIQPRSIRGCELPAGAR